MLKSPFIIARETKRGSPIDIEIFSLKDTIKRRGERERHKGHFPAAHAEPTASRAETRGERRKATEAARECEDVYIFTFLYGRRDVACMYIAFFKYAIA